MTIYVVMGSSGKYSDRTEWPVAWYYNKNLAESHGDRAAEEAVRIGRLLRDNDTSWYEVVRTEHQPRNTFDPDMQFVDDRADYYVIEVRQGKLP